MNPSSVIERLAALPTLAAIPREQLEWLVEHGEVRRFDDGATPYRKGEALPGLLVMLSGRFSVRVDQDGVEREVREVTTGRISGVLPYSRMTTPRGYLVADGPVELVQLPLDQMRELTRECYDLTAICVHEMLDRVRTFKSDDKQQEKMAALGRLSAGLAHELNNPASAVARGAAELEKTGLEVAAAARALGAAGLGTEAAAAVERLEGAARRAPEEPLSPVAQADREDRFTQWLDEHGVDADLAYSLAGTGLTIDDLDAAAEALSHRPLGDALRYVAAASSATRLAADVRSGADRIHSLVAAVKKHTHMDRAAAVEPIRVAGHLADTLTLMRAKAASKNVSLELTVEAELPPVQGIVADLNQVWIHLVDNAIDAAPESGHVSVEASSDAELVVVQVVDDGPGVPPGDRERVFEPFFTTKDIQQGRGLGLDIVQSVVRSHKGTVDLDCEPGRTVFRVALPASRG